jgi:hypothetical protein
MTNARETTTATGAMTRRAPKKAATAGDAALLKMAREAKLRLKHINQIITRFKEVEAQYEP